MDTWIIQQRERGYRCWKWLAIRMTNGRWMAEWKSTTKNFVGGKFWRSPPSIGMTDASHQVSKHLYKTQFYPADGVQNRSSLDPIKMKIIVFLLIATMTVVYGQLLPSNFIRLLVLPKTTTATVTATVTTTVPTSVTQSCATTLASLTVCRKRRSVMESEEQPTISPTKPNTYCTNSFRFLRHDSFDVNVFNDRNRLMVTASPESRSYGMDGYGYGSQAIAEPQEPLAPVQVEPSIQNTAGMAEIQIRDLDAVCRARSTNQFLGVGLAQLLGITLLYSTTVTTNVTSTVFTTTVVKNNTFTIQGCLPSPLPFTLC